jgi:uncharacterized protein DUF4389
VQFRDGAGSSVPLGAVSVGLLIAGICLLFTGRYPRGRYDLLLGIARWSLRVIAYLALLSDQYPPFRLDQGDDEPGPGPHPAGPVDAHSHPFVDADRPPPVVLAEPQGSAI